MHMPMDHDDQAVCTVTQMAKKVGMSRPRFYELVKAEVFPPPAYCPATRMPLYPLELQEVCLKVRRTGIGFKGQSVRFYDRKAKRPDADQKQVITILRKMGLSVTTAEIRRALQDLKLPRTGERPTDPEVIRTLFQHLHGARQNVV